MDRPTQVKKSALKANSQSQLKLSISPRVPDIRIESMFLTRSEEKEITPGIKTFLNTKVKRCTTGRIFFPNTKHKTA